MKKFCLFLIFGFSVLCAKTPSLDAMISQMLMVGFSGTDVQDKWVEQIGKEIRKDRIGGVILFKRNISSPKQLKALTKYLQAQNKLFVPLFIGVDQEGGKVQRLDKSNGFSHYLSAQELAQEKTLQRASKEYENLSNELYEYGFNLNFAPVVDLNLNPKSPAIGGKQRSYSNAEEIVYAYSNIFIKKMHQAHILSVLKHFPGHGSATNDSHKGFTDITDTWKYKELKPYFDFIARKRVDMIMVGHLTNRNFDKRYPATLSKNMIEGILRQKLHFQGVVISDDMQMGAIKKNFSMQEAIVKSINAGVDIVLFSTYFYEKSNIVKTFHILVKDAVKKGKISKKRIEQSYRRIIRLKKSLR
jgi:beta-N-acetylhexosaminidase